MWANPTILPTMESIGRQNSALMRHRVTASLTLGVYSSVKNVKLQNGQSQPDSSSVKTPWVGSSGRDWLNSCCVIFGFELGNFCRPVFPIRVYILQVMHTFYINLNNIVEIFNSQSKKASACDILTFRILFQYLCVTLIITANLVFFQTRKKHLRQMKPF